MSLLDKAADLISFGRNLSFSDLFSVNSRLVTRWKQNSCQHLRVHCFASDFILEKNA